MEEPPRKRQRRASDASEASQNMSQGAPLDTLGGIVSDFRAYFNDASPAKEVEVSFAGADAVTTLIFRGEWAKGLLPLISIGHKLTVYRNQCEKVTLGEDEDRDERPPQPDIESGEDKMVKGFVLPLPAVLASASVGFLSFLSASGGGASVVRATFAIYGTIG